MKYSTHGNGNGLNDLYILPETQAERHNLQSLAKTNGWNYGWCFSDVKGQDWHGKQFMEIPFGECRRVEIEAYFQTATA
jgi:hypothetical protein